MLELEKNIPVSFYYLNMATRKFLIAHVVHIMFILGNRVLDSPS